MRRNYESPSSDDIPLYNQFTVLFPAGDLRTKKSCNPPLRVRNGDGMKKLEQEGHSSKSREEKPSRNNLLSDIAHDQKSGRRATDGQLKSSKSKEQNSFKPSKSGSRTQSNPPSDGEGFSLESDIFWPFARLKLPIRLCVFACIIWLIKCYIMSSLDTRYTQMQIQMETLTSSINDLQQGIPPTDEEYQTWMNYEGFAV